MSRSLRKLSEILKEMSEQLYRDPAAIPTSEAAHMALFLANMAWNETVGMDHPRDSYRPTWQTLAADNPLLWSELKSRHVDDMIDELIRYKQRHYPHDRRRILICGIPDGKIHVEWLPPAAPGVDVKWETHLYGLVRTGHRDQAIHLLTQTRNLPRRQAANRVAKIAAELGIG